MVKREVAGGRQTLIVAPRKVRLKLTGEKPGGDIPHYTSWSGADITHFGRHLGSNKWKDFDTVIVFREQLPPIEAERMARAIWADDRDVTLTLGGEYIQEFRHHDTRDGVGPAVKVHVHPDPHVQSLVELHRENAMGQGIDRLRFIHRDPARPGKIIIVSNIPVPGVIVDRLMPLDDVLDGGTIWERAFKAMPGGVIPLSRDWLVTNLGKLFPSNDIARAAIKRLTTGNVGIWDIPIPHITAC